MKPAAIDSPASKQASKRATNETMALQESFHAMPDDYYTFNELYNGTYSDEVISSFEIFPTVPIFTSGYSLQTTVSVRWNQTRSSIAEFLANHADVYNETDGILTPVSDVSVNAVLTAVVLNSALGVTLLLLYEVLRRVMPSVYRGNRTFSSSDSPSSWSPLWMVNILKISW